MLDVSARWSARTGGAPALLVDGLPVALGEDRRGRVPVEGSCGDGSRHVLLYAFRGAPGDWLSVALCCGGRQVCAVRKATITPSGAPVGGGRRSFSL